MPFHFLCKFHANWYAETCFCANLTVGKCTKIASQCVPYAVPLPVQVSRKLVRGNLLLCEPDCREVYENSFSMRPICRSLPVQFSRKLVRGNLRLYEPDCR